MFSLAILGFYVNAVYILMEFFNVNKGELGICSVFQHNKNIPNNTRVIVHDIFVR